MPQRKYPFVKGTCYHIYNRGHNKQTIFLSNNDFTRYLTRLKEYLKKHPVTLLAYCLMPNHIHLIISQDDEEPIEKFIHRLHTSYTMYFNKKYERVGAVFQGRFKAKPINTDEYLLHVSRYIHLNPSELSSQGRTLSLSLRRYPWSSYKEYVKDIKNIFSNPNRILNYFSTNHNTSSSKLKYKHFVEDGLKSMNPSLIGDISNGNIPNL